MNEQIISIYADFYIHVYILMCNFVFVSHYGFWSCDSVIWPLCWFVKNKYIICEISSWWCFQLPDFIYLYYLRSQFNYCNPSKYWKYWLTLVDDWIEFYAVSAIFQPCNGGDYLLNVISFEILKFPWRPS